MMPAPTFAHSAATSRPLTVKALDTGRRDLRLPVRPEQLLDAAVRSYAYGANVCPENAPLAFTVNTSGPSFDASAGRSSAA